jgi:hypothetical protein
MGKSRDKHPLEDNPFADDLLEWMGSAEGQAHIDMSDVLWALLGDVQLDAAQRKLVWPDAKRLSFDESVQRICKQHADFEREDVRDFLLSWLENYAPDGYTAEQMDELDRLANAWAEDLRARGV